MTSDLGSRCNQARLLGKGPITHASDPINGTPGWSSPHRFQVLALDGGGAKALFTAYVLARLEADLGVCIAEAFDLIAGTSAGGLIALALGAGMRPAEIVDHYATLTARVFPHGRWARWGYALRPWTNAYSGDVLRQALEEVLGSRLLGQSHKRLVIPSWDVQRGEVHVFKTPHHERLRRDWQISMVDVAMATTAAPTFFPAAAVDGQRLVDGGVWANNPSVVAIGEAVSMLDVPLRSIRVLNVGTVDQRTPHPKRFDGGGWATWATTATSLMLTAPSTPALAQWLSDDDGGPVPLPRPVARVGPAQRIRRLPRPPVRLDRRRRSRTIRRPDRALPRVTAPRPSQQCVPIRDARRHA